MKGLNTLLVTRIQECSEIAYIKTPVENGLFSNIIIIFISSKKSMNKLSLQARFNINSYV